MICCAALIAAATCGLTAIRRGLRLIQRRFVVVGIFTRGFKPALFSLVFIFLLVTGMSLRAEQAYQFTPAGSPIQSETDSLIDWVKAIEDSWCKTIHPGRTTPN